MKVVSESVHLPRCPVNAEAYERLYAFNQGLDNQMPESATWQQIRIKPGSSEIDIYRLLPSAFDFEYSGYLTKSRVRFFGRVLGSLHRSKSAKFRHISTVFRHKLGCFGKTRRFSHSFNDPRTPPILQG